MNIEKSKKLSGATDSLNKALGKALQSFAANTEWTDIHNWLENVQTLLTDFPSPFIADKILLSKRLNQCMNPILPEKVHETVLNIHQRLFKNMRVSVDGNINDYIKLFAEDLGVYSVSMLPHLVHTNNCEQRLLILSMVNNYYIDLGKELIPMLAGMLKSLLSVYSTTINPRLVLSIQFLLQKILLMVGRRYVVGCTWSLILKYKDCKEGGIKFLSKVIDKMEYIKGEESFDESRGFSDLQRDIKELQMQEKDPLNPAHLPLPDRKSKQKVLEHLQGVQDSPYNSLDFSPIPELNTPGKTFAAITTEFQSTEGKGELGHLAQDIALEKIVQQKYEQSINQSTSKIERPEVQWSQDEGAVMKLRNLYESQAPFKNTILQDENEIKLNSVPLMVSQGIAQIKEGIDSNITENNFPNLNTLVINALISCLEEDQPLIRRAVLDFLFSHLRIKSELLGDEEKKVLVEALLRLFKKKEISITKRVNRWIFGKEDEDNQYTINEKNQFVIPLLIHAFKKILQTLPTSQENCTFPLKILQNFYIQHPHLVQPTLSQIALHLLRYIFNFGSPIEDKGSKAIQFHEQVLKIGKRFLENLPSYYTVIFHSLGQAFLQAVRDNRQDRAFEAVKYIDFCFINLMKHEHGFQELQYITIILEYVCKGLSELSSPPELQKEKENKKLYKIYLKDAVLLVYNLIERRKSVKKINRKEQDNINIKYFQETGDTRLPPERIQYQEELRKRQMLEQERYVQINQRLQAFFIRLGQVVRSFANIQDFEQTFKLCSMAMAKLQIHLPPIEVSVLPRWFNILEGAIKVNNPIVSLASIEAMIKCLMWENKHPLYNSFKTIIMQEKVNKIGTDYQKLALEKLWSLLDFPHMHSKIIDLIVGFSKYFPYEFTDTVKRSFSTHSAPDKQASIQRFSHFWRLTGYKYKDLLNVYKEFVQLNKVGLFRMLDFLDDQNPLVRHAAKNWLMESMTFLTRVIQPLMAELISGCQEWYETPKGIFLIQNVYDTNNIFSTFRRIRSILSNGSYTFLRFVYQTEISDALEEQKDKVTSITYRLLTTEENDQLLNPATLTEQRQPVLPKALESLQKSEAKGSRLSYLDLLIILAVKYIQGHAIQSMGIQFYIGNSGVNTSAVQLIQTLLDYIDNPILCEKLISYIMDFLFKVLNQVVTNKEYIMQIQLINLIRNIFFNSSFRKKGEITRVRAFFKTVFTNKLFLVSVLDGLHTPFAYVRSQFITFITVCIPLIADFLDPLECTECIRHILYTYYKIIKDIGGSLARAVVEDNTEEEEGRVGRNLSMSKIFQLEAKIKMQQKFVKFSDNLKQVGKTNEILSVLHGVQSILNYFYDLNKLDVKSLHFEFSNPYTLFDTFKKIITLGLASSEKNAKLIERRNFLHNFQTCEALLKDLQPVYETILRSWPLSEQFVRIGSQQFSSIGMRSFNFQRFSKYNKVVRQLIGYVQQQKQSIWGKIYCIMQPMFCTFPKQIIDIYLKLWIRECSSVKNQTGKPVSQPDKTELLMKIMQTIIVNNFPMNVVIHAFLESTAISELTHYYESRGSDKKGTVLDYTIDKSQSKLLYFIYVYFNYVYLNEKQLTYQPLLEVWSLIIKVLRPFQKSKTPLASIWIIEIINLCAKKYSPKELLKNQRFKTDLHALINEKLKYLASIASRKQVLFFGLPLGPNSRVKFSEEQQKGDQYHVVLPLPPTIYDIHRTRKQQRNHSDHLALKQFRAGENSELQSRYRVYCFKILKRLGYQILQNTYLPEKAHWVVTRTCEWMELILPVIEDKSLSNMTFAQCSSQILFDILERARTLFVKPLKARVLEIFNRDDFFICSANTLQYWARIIDWIVSLDKNHQTYFEYLGKVSLSSSYFTSQSLQNKKRVKSFERICFILYSGQKDRYATRLKPLLQKIADVIKKPQNVHAALLILVLFAIRILILRLSQISLGQLFIDIWPMILTLLMQTFSKQLVRVHIHNEISKNPNYLLAALKLVEMISLTNLGEFAHHQWIFITDYFGVDITVPEVTQQMTEHFLKRPQLARILHTSSATASSPFLYRPYLLNYLPQSSINYLPQQHQDIVIQYTPQKRLIMVKDSFIRDQTQLKLNAALLMQYMIHLNQFRTIIDWKQVQQVIVNDFINLDSFIHQIS